MWNDLDGRAVIVTGAGSILRRYPALALGRAGTFVVVNDLLGSDRVAGSAAQSVARELRAAGGQAVISWPLGIRTGFDKAADFIRTVDGARTRNGRAARICLLSWGNVPDRRRRLELTARAGALP